MNSYSSSSSTSPSLKRFPGAATRCSIKERFADWVTRHQRVAGHEIKIDRRRIYILPTVYGYCYALTLMLMLLGALNYNNSMAFLFTFLLAGLGANAMWDTHRNLLNIIVRKAGSQAVFAGHTARFDFIVRNDSSRRRHALVLRCRDARPTVIDIAPGAETVASLRVVATKRGVLRPGRLRFDTQFPLGLFRAWTWMEFDLWTHVYPAPSKPGSPALMDDRYSGQTARSEEGGEDFSGLRPFRDGDPPGHIAWKAMARNDVLLTKLFSGETGRALWLDWNALRTQDTEQRLGVLCAMLLEARRYGIRYGLRLPHRVIEPASGSRHDTCCLQALAMFGLT